MPAHPPHPRNPPHRRLYNLLRRPWADKWLILQVVVLLGVSRLAILTVPFGRLERLLGQRWTESDKTTTLDALRQARRVAWAIWVVSPLTPWTSNCFPQALAAKTLLGRRGISSTLYMGAAFTPGESALEAHVWLRCGPLFVTGGNGSRRFGAVAAFR